MKKNTGFRGWFYFRMGYSSYFAFIFAAVNTLTVTYYLAVERYPTLQAIFPNFSQYVVIVAAIGIPLLILVGYSHFKKTQAYRSEAEISMESDPFRRRMVINTEILVNLNLKLTEMILKLSQDEKLSSEELDKIKKTQQELSNFVKERTFQNQKDLLYFKQMA